MKKVSFVVLNMALMAGLSGGAGAAGTYYNTGAYQQRYGANNNGGYYNSYGAGRPSALSTQTQSRAVQKTQSQRTSVSNNTKKGFQIGADLTHQMASWKFDMKTAGSSLHYDDLRWNVVGANAVYYFGDSLPMQLKVGANYGVQFGESAMFDDDLTTDNIWESFYINVDDSKELAIHGTPAVSIGNSKDGKQYGFNAAFGFTDLFNVGRVKMTPSVGYRYLRYELETKTNKGLAIEVLDSGSFVNCIEVQTGEIQCSPFIGFANGSGQLVSYAGFSVDSNGNLVQNPDGSYIILNDPSAAQLSAGDTFYYEQSGVSHRYETEWAGPYLALDMEYAIDNDNIVNAGVEFGLPVYKSTGDQPYRFDWLHSPSVEDKGDFGDAYHIGLNAMWSTSISESIMLSLGMTYDYYHVKDATATTYLNPEYYQAVLDKYETDFASNVFVQGSYAYDYMLSLRDAKSTGWVLKNDKEVESVYKSMGVRVGLNVKF